MLNKLKRHRKTRPAVLPVILADDESLDTGDESDNVDLTDDDRSESDWSVAEEGKLIGFIVRLS